jgi:polyphosphate kinase
MEYKNTKYNKYGTIDCDINHPEFGWITTTLSPEDPETADLFNEVLSNGDIAEYEEVQLTPEQIEEQNIQEIRRERNKRLEELDRPLWLENLTVEHKEIIDTYYQALLDAPQTMVLPDRPDFI